jgi:hypothetical protein
VSLLLYTTDPRIVLLVGMAIGYAVAVVAEAIAARRKSRPVCTPGRCHCADACVMHYLFRAQ